MRIVCIVFVFLGVINGIAIADQGHHLGLLDEMPSPDDVQRHLQAQKNIKKRGDGGGGGNADSTGSSGNENFDGEFKKVITKRFGDDKNNPNNNRRPLSQEEQKKKEELQQKRKEELLKDRAKFENSKAILVEKVRKTVGEGMAKKVKKELQNRGCLRRNLREVRDSRILIVPNLAEDSRANDDDDKAGKKRRLVETREELKEREDRLQELKKLGGLAEAMNEKEKIEVVKAMKDLGC